MHLVDGRRLDDRTRDQPIEAGVGRARDPLDGAIQHPFRREDRLEGLPKAGAVLRD